MKVNKQTTFPVGAVIIVVAELLVIGGAFLLWPAGDGGTAKLAVPQSTIDEGYLAYNVPIQTAFTLRNEGNGPLKILDTPVVELKEGC